MKSNIPVSTANLHKSRITADDFIDGHFYSIKYRESGNIYITRFESKNLNWHGFSSTFRRDNEPLDVSLSGVFILDHMESVVDLGVEKISYGPEDFELRQRYKITVDWTDTLYEIVAIDKEDSKVYSHFTYPNSPTNGPFYGAFPYREITSVKKLS